MEQAVSTKIALITLEGVLIIWQLEDGLKKLLTRLGKAGQWGKSLHISMGAQVQIPSTHEKHLCVLVALMLKASGRQVPKDPASKNRSQKDVEEDSPLVCKCANNTFKHTCTHKSFKKDNNMTWWKIALPLKSMGIKRTVWGKSSEKETEYKIKL